MGRAAIVPATLALDASGTPYSPQYRDIYHSADSGPGQARHVFLGGNGLPARWARARVFTLLETGFGIGVNFLAVWQAARDDPARPERLHMVSIEKHPFDRDSLATLHARYPEFAPLAAELRADWPLPLPGLHRMEFDDGRVTLTLALGDIADVLPKLRLAADAIFLDGFAPDRNPEMWTSSVMRAIARLSRPGTTLATYTAARSVRDALAAAGFAPESRTGFGRKRDMLAARFTPRGATRHGPSAEPLWGNRSAIVVGAGLAGAAAGQRLATRGWRVELIERQSAPAAKASGIPAGVFHPHLSRDDSVLSRLTRAGYLHALRHWHALDSAGYQLPWERCGVLQIARDAREEERMAATVRALGFPHDYVEYLPQAGAIRKSGRDVRAGGWWFPDSGWMRLAGLVTAQIAASRAGGNLTLRTGLAVEALDREGDRWRALDVDGKVIASAPVVVLANSHDAVRLAPLDVQLRRVRGQLTRLPAARMTAPAAVLAGAGHLIPDTDGGTIIGATYDFDSEIPEPRTEDHAGNLKRLEGLLPGTAAGIDPAALEGAVGFRCVAADRLPLIGALPDAGALLPGDTLRNASRTPGLYGAFAYASRGLTWAALGAELIAGMVDGEPLPLECDLADAIDPARFALRRARRGKP